jgi:BAAT / Acyl-CoA thioester hydrolase C terminal
VRNLTVHNPIIATLYQSDQSVPLPGVLVIGGSDGGPGAPGVAPPGLPPTLENIPLEYFQKALLWMRSQPSIDSRSIAIYAESRGTEAALSTAASDPKVSAVVARSPSFVYWSGITKTHLPGKSAWTLHGRAQPFVTNTLYPDFIMTYLWDRATGIPVRQAPLFLEDLAHAEEPDKISIPVERIYGPVP